MNMNTRKIEFVTCHVAPNIGPKPRNTFSKKELKDWEFLMTPAGVYVKALFQMPGDRVPRIEEHVLPYSAIRQIKLFPESADDEAKSEKPEKKAA